MKRSPEWLLIATPFAIGAGFAFQQAVSNGSTVAWCLFTACSMVCLIILFLTSLYVWYCRQAENDSRIGAYCAGNYFEGWPKELDILLSSKCSDERRALAAAQLAVKAILERWPYRSDTIRVLEDIATSRGGSDIVVASVLGALGQFQPKESRPAVIEAARNTRNRYVLSAAMPLLASRAETRIDLMNIVNVTADDANVQYCGASALKVALENAKTLTERKEIEADMQEIASTGAVSPPVKRLVAEWLKTSAIPR